MLATRKKWHIAADGSLRIPAPTRWLMMGRSRFISPDPLGHGASMSLYDYANGDPVNGLDPDGRFGKVVVNGVTNFTQSLIKGQPILGDSSVGNVLRKDVPLVGGMLGAAADIGSGAIKISMGLGTFGQSGTLKSGFDEVSGGAGSLLQIGGYDAAGAALGVVGKAYVTMIAAGNLATGGQFILPDHSNLGREGPTKPPEATGPIGAIGKLARDMAIPTYGFMLGAGWGVTQWGQKGPYLNQADYFSRVHDGTMEDREWVNNQWRTTPPGVVANGPVADALVLIGSPVFWLHDGHGNP